MFTYEYTEAKINPLAGALAHGHAPPAPNERERLSHVVGSSTESRMRNWMSVFSAAGNQGFDLDRLSDFRDVVVTPREDGFRDYENWIVLCDWLCHELEAHVVTGIHRDVDEAINLLPLNPHLPLSYVSLMRAELQGIPVPAASPISPQQLATLRGHLPQAISAHNTLAADLVEVQKRLQNGAPAGALPDGQHHTTLTGLFSNPPLDTHNVPLVQGTPYELVAMGFPGGILYGVTDVQVQAEFVQRTPRVLQSLFLVSHHVIGLLQAHGQRAAAPASELTRTEAMFVSRLSRWRLLLENLIQGRSFPSCMEFKKGPFFLLLSAFSTGVPKVSAETDFDVSFVELPQMNVAMVGAGAPVAGAPVPAAMPGALPVVAPPPGRLPDRLDGFFTEAKSYSRGHDPEELIQLSCPLSLLRIQLEKIRRGMPLNGPSPYSSHNLHLQSLYDSADPSAPLAVRRLINPAQAILPQHGNWNPHASLAPLFLFDNERVVV